MSGPTPKPPDRRQRRNSRAGEGQVVPFSSGKPASIPKAPEDILDSTKEAWDEFWQSELAKVVVPETDGAAISQLFMLYDERERAYREFRKERIVRGSQGQNVLNPLGKLWMDLGDKITSLEDRLGMNPRARLQLGIVFGQAAKSLQELNENLDRNDDSDSGQVVEIDPREATTA